MTTRNNRSSLSPSPQPSFVSHFMSTPPSQLLFFQCLPLSVVMSLAYGFYNLLSSSFVSYYFHLCGLILAAVSTVALYPDKMARIMAVPTTILIAVFSSYHLSFISSRCFLYLSGLVGIIICIGLAILSVFSGTHVSKSVEVACFALAILTPITSGMAQILRIHPKSFFIGTMISCAASMFNLVFNRSRTEQWNADSNQNGDIHAIKDIRR